MARLKEEDFQQEFDWGLWKKLLRYLQPYRKEVLILALVMIGVGGIDALFPIMTRYAIDNYVVPGNTAGLPRFALIYGLLVSVQAVNVWLLIDYAGRVETGMSYDIRRAGFKHLQEQSFSYYDRTAVGWLMARMTSDTRRLGEVISWGLVDSVWGLAMMLTIVVIMFVLNWKLALITLTVVPVLAGISLFFQKKILRAYRQVRKINSRITGAFNEGIMGARTTKTLVREEENLREFTSLTGEMRASSIRAAGFLGTLPAGGIDPGEYRHRPGPLVGGERGCPGDHQLRYPGGLCLLYHSLLRAHQPAGPGFCRAADGSGLGRAHPDHD